MDVDVFVPSIQEIKKALVDIKEYGIDLGAGDYVELESLKVAYRVMRYYLELIGEEV